MANAVSKSSPQKSRHPFADAFSAKRIREMNDAERRGPILARVYASDLPLGSAEQQRLVMHRIAKGLCLECAVSRGGGEFCGACLAKYPIVENVGEPFDGWQFR